MRLSGRIRATRARRARSNAIDIGLLAWAKTSRANAFWMRVVALVLWRLKRPALGAQVVAIDLSPTLVDLARERIPARCGALGGVSQRRHA